MKIAIIKYNAGNVQSVAFALNRLGIDPILTDDPAILTTADKVIFPGVGEASTTMRCLIYNGLDKVIPTLKQPVLGICLGMQLMCNYSEENDTKCLGIFDTNTIKFASGTAKIPHMGWNEIKNSSDSKLTMDLPDSHMYFVHSFHVPINEHTISTCTYIAEYSAVLQKKNFSAVQFHPEKSSKQGLKLIKNFIEL